MRLTTIVDIHTALVDKRTYRLPFTHAKAFMMMEQMEGKLDQHLLKAFRPVVARDLLIAGGLATGRDELSREGHAA